MLKNNFAWHLFNPCDFPFQCEKLLSEKSFSRIISAVNARKQSFDLESSSGIHNRVPCCKVYTGECLIRPDEVLYIFTFYAHQVACRALMYKP